ncbi:MAG: hypothetical protein ACREQR_04540 [Candidatus Binataceae bacterium]
MAEWEAEAWRCTRGQRRAEAGTIPTPGPTSGGFERAPDPDRRRYLAILADVLSRVLERPICLSATACAFVSRVTQTRRCQVF